MAIEGSRGLVTAAAAASVARSRLYDHFATVSIHARAGPTVGEVPSLRRFTPA
jgi:hypothetical protein